MVSGLPSFHSSFKCKQGFRIYIRPGRCEKSDSFSIVSRTSNYHRWKSVVDSVLSVELVADQLSPYYGFLFIYEYVTPHRGWNSNAYLENRNSERIITGD